MLSSDLISSIPCPSPCLSNEELCSIARQTHNTINFISESFITLSSQKRNIELYPLISRLKNRIKLLSQIDIKHKDFLSCVEEVKNKYEELKNSVSIANLDDPIYPFLRTGENISIGKQTLLININESSFLLSKKNSETSPFAFALYAIDSKEQMKFEPGTLISDTKTGLRIFAKDNDTVCFWRPQIEAQEILSSLNIEDTIHPTQFKQRIYETFSPEIPRLIVCNDKNYFLTRDNVGNFAIENVDSGEATSIPMNSEWVNIDSDFYAMAPEFRPNLNDNDTYILITSNLSSHRDKKR
ncbi:MAG: hypothetical protein CMO81_01695 [Waddliaceae bacterium]|nr:hypothetical protein [Waddliaceae bacterium]